MQFIDYHRTVVGYHGTRLSTAVDIVSRRRKFESSTNTGDWLGSGVYFWEYAPRQALRWAEQRRDRQGWDEPIAVVASMIRLGFCFDLLDPANVEFLREAHNEFVATSEVAGLSIPQNFNQEKRLDCSVFEYAYRQIESREDSGVDTSRAVYVPTGSGRRLWPRSWIADDAHIQLCVRNPACIMGSWLHHPESLESPDVAAAAEDASSNAADGIEPQDRTSD